MEKIFPKVKEMTGTIKEYVNTRIIELKLEVAENASGTIARLLAFTLAGIIFLYFFIFVGIALSLLLGAWLGKTWAGFMIIGCLYLIIGIIVWIRKNKVFRMAVLNALTNILFNSDEEV